MKATGTVVASWRSVTRREMNAALQRLKADWLTSRVQGHNLPVQDDGGLQSFRELFEEANQIRKLAGLVITQPGENEYAARPRFHRNEGSNPIVLRFIDELESDSDASTSEANIGRRIAASINQPTVCSKCRILGKGEPDEISNLWQV